MKINFSKLASAIIKVGTPIVTAAILHKVATGKLDVKGAALDAVAEAIAKRQAG